MEGRESASERKWLCRTPYRQQKLDMSSSRSRRLGYRRIQLPTLVYSLLDSTSILLWKSTYGESFATIDKKKWDSYVNEMKVCYWQVIDCDHRTTDMIRTASVPFFACVRCISCKYSERPTMMDTTRTPMTTLCLSHKANIRRAIITGGKSYNLYYSGHQKKHILCTGTTNIHVHHKSTFVAPKHNYAFVIHELYDSRVESYSHFRKDLGRNML